MIRKYEGDDINRMSTIWLEASFLAHDFIPRSYWESRAEDMRKVYLPSSLNYVYIEEITGEIAGFISVSDNYLPALFVTPSMQKRGIGKELMDFVKQSHDYLTLNVYADNRESVDFYKKQGFVIIKESIDEHTGHKEYLMEYKAE